MQKNYHFCYLFHRWTTVTKSSASIIVCCSGLIRPKPNIIHLHYYSFNACTMLWNNKSLKLKLNNYVLHEQDHQHLFFFSIMIRTKPRSGNLFSLFLVFPKKSRKRVKQEIFVPSAYHKHGQLILQNGCSHSVYVIESNTHCCFSMKYWKNW